MVGIELAKYLARSFSHLWFLFLLVLSSFHGVSDQLHEAEEHCVHLFQNNNFTLKSNNSTFVRFYLCYREPVFIESEPMGCYHIWSQLFVCIEEGGPCILNACTYGTTGGIE